MHSSDITLKNLSKIEGHAHLEIKIKKGKVQSCRLRVGENNRFFKQTVIGKNYREAPSLMSRICGTCSSAHVLAAIDAIENALNIKPSEQTIIMRKLLINANHLRDHAMHLYFFVLPDIFNMDSVLDFPDNLHHWIHHGLDLKEAGNFLSVAVAGRAIHPPNALIGGFSQIPSKKDIQLAKQKLVSSKQKLLKLIQLLHKTNWKLKRKTNCISLFNKDYNFINGFLKTANNTTIPEKDFLSHLKEVVIPYSTSSAFKFESKEYFVGARARLNLNKQALHPNTKTSLKKYLKRFPSDNIFDNNLAQAIEMFNIIESSLELLNYNFKKEPLKKTKNISGEGAGTVEAPRGTLFYRIKIANSKVKDLDFCIPTQQNIIPMQNSISKFVEENISLSKKEVVKWLEKIIRAYDPCMSCAANFLKLKIIKT